MPRGEESGLALPRLNAPSAGFLGLASEVERAQGKVMYVQAYTLDDA